MKRKHLYYTLVTLAFGTQTVYTDAGPCWIAFSGHVFWGNPCVGSCLRRL